MKRMQSWVKRGDIDGQNNIFYKNQDNQNFEYFLTLIKKFRKKKFS